MPTTLISTLLSSSISTGPQGTQGVTGSQGTTDSQGTTASQGTTGTQGTTGSQGISGSFAAQGVQGATGTGATVSVVPQRLINKGLGSLTNIASNISIGAGGTASAAWKIQGLIRREGTAATTTLIASTITAISNVPTWTLALSADTSYGSLVITATGAAATNIRWTAAIQVNEVTYA